MTGQTQSRLLAAFVAVVLAAACGSFGGSSVPAPGGIPPATTAPGGSYVLGEIVVKYRSAMAPQSLGVSRVVRTATAESGSFSFALVKVPEGQEAEYISIYARQPNVEYAELNLIVTLVDGERVTVTGGGVGGQAQRPQQDGSLPTDPKLTEFNAAFKVVRLDGTTVPDSEATVQWDMHRIKMRDAWQLADGRGVKVAITDTGVDCTHPQLSGKCLEGYDAVDGRVISPGENSDTHGHGTHVAGTVAAKADGVDMVGVAPGVQIIPIRLLGPRGGTTFMVVNGMIKAADLGCRVFNASWGGVVPSRSQLDAILYAIGKGCVPVFAAGNEYDRLGNPPTYPASFAAEVAGMLAVGSSTPTDRISTFSSSGRYVTVAAPGEPIYSLFPTAQGSAGFIQGTSMAAPHVAGIVALMLQRNPNLTPAQVKTIVQNTARPPCPGYPKPDYDGGRCGTYSPGKGAYGWGIVDAAAAVQAAASP